MMMPLPLLVPFVISLGWTADPVCAASTAFVAGTSPAPLLGTGKLSWDLQPAGTASWLPTQMPDQTLRIPLAGPVFLFGQAEKDNLAPAQNSRFVGQTGVTWKLPVQAGVELLLSCGPEVTYVDTPRTDRVQERLPLPVQTRLLRVDVQCRWHVLARVGLECQGSVCPALNPGELDEFYQDLHLAFTLNPGGQFNIGARRYWEKAADAKPGPESGELYGDIRLSW